MVSLEVGVLKRSLRWCVVVLSCLFVIGLGALAEACTITVQPGESIQAAIDAASDGAVVCLAGGRWEENLTISKSLTLRGEGANQSEITPKVHGPVVTVTSSREYGVQVFIEDLRVSGAWGWGLGILIDESAQVTINRITVSSNAYAGIWVEESAWALINASTISENGRGIMHQSLGEVGIINCTVSNNQLGIAVRYSAQAAVTKSNISRNDYGIVLYHSPHVSITDCTVSRNGESMLIGGWAEAHVVNTTVSENECGIVLHHSAQLTLEESSIQRNRGYGIALFAAPCFDNEGRFTGRVAGRSNRISAPSESDVIVGGTVCPSELGFLMTAQGGELDWQEEE